MRLQSTFRRCERRHSTTRFRLGSLKVEARELRASGREHTGLSANAARVPRRFGSPPKLYPVIVTAPATARRRAPSRLAADLSWSRFPQGGNETESAFPLPVDFDWIGFHPGFGAVNTDDPMLPADDPLHWPDSSLEAFADRFMDWTEATIPDIVGGVPATCPSQACVITDPLDPIILGPRASFSVIISPAVYQWFWVGGLEAGTGGSFVVEVFAEGYGQYGIDEYRTPSAGALLSGACVRGRQRIPSSSIEIEISRGMYEDNGANDVVIMYAGRTGGLW